MQDSTARFRQGANSLAELTRLPPNLFKGSEERVREILSWMDESFEKSPSLRSEYHKLDLVREYLETMLANRNYDHSAEMVRDMLYSFRLHHDDWENPVDEPPTWRKGQRNCGTNKS